MNHTRRKDTLRLIRNSKGRYITLILIVLIGTAFFTGVTASSTMMAANVDTYNDELNLKDITIYSNYGFDEEDITAISNIDSVAKAEGSKFVDVLAVSHDDSRIMRIHSYSETDEINQFILVDGRLPENDNEIVAEAGSDLSPGFALGTTLTLSRPQNDLDDWLSTNEVTIVGIIDTPLYINTSKESSTINNQDIQTYCYIPDEAFTIDYDLEVNVVLEDAKRCNSFYDAYEEYVSTQKQTIQELASTQANHRKEIILEEALSSYEDGYQEYLDGVDTFEKEIEDGQKQLDDALELINSSQSQIDQAEAELDQSLQTLNTQIAAGQSEIDAGYIQYNNGLAQYESSKTAFDTQKQELASTVSTMQAGILQIDENIAQLESIKESYPKLESGLQTIHTSLESITPIQTMFSQFDDATLNMSFSNFKQGLQTSLSPLKTYVEANPNQVVFDYITEGFDTTQLNDFNSFMMQYGDDVAAEVIVNNPNYFLKTIGLPIDTSNTLNEYLSISLKKVVEDTELLINLSANPIFSSPEETDTLQKYVDVVNITITDLQSQKTTLEAQKKSIDDSLATQGFTILTIDDLISSLRAQRLNLTAQIPLIEQGIAQGEVQLTEALTKLQNSLNALVQAQQNLNSIRTSLK